MKKMKFREVVPQAEFTAVELEARSTLWRQGDLSWKLKGKQVDLYNDIIDQTKDVSVILCARRLRKIDYVLSGCC